MQYAPLLARREELLALDRSLDAQLAQKEQERAELLGAIQEEVRGVRGTCCPKKCFKDVPK